MIDWKIFMKFDVSKTSCLFFSLTFGLCFSSCTTMSSPREERHKLELSLHKLRTELEDIKHDLNSSNIEMHILESKLIDQQDNVVSMKQHMTESQGSKIEDLEQIITSIHKRLSQIEKKQEEVVADLRELGTHANETTAALSQYKEKISDVEKSIHGQNSKFEEISKLKKNLDLLASDKKSSVDRFDKYTVKEGDSLKKISRIHNISVEDLKKMNHLQEDLIMVGQEILVPSSQK